MVDWLKVGVIFLGLMLCFYLMFMGAVLISSWMSGIV